jgi:cobalt-zinc-cadmium efflux system outer membrane protein
MTIQDSDAQGATGIRPDLDATGTLTLDGALAFAVRHNPRLLKKASMARSWKARRRQAGLRANPEVEVEVENVGGAGEAKEFDAAETTLQLSQSLDLAGKRGKREQLASRAAAIAEWELEIARLDLIAEVGRRFVEVLAAR